MKKEIMGYIAALINVGIDNAMKVEKLEDEELAMKVLEVTNNRLFGLQDFVADLKEEPSSTDESIHVKRIVELQNENEELEKRVTNLINNNEFVSQQSIGFQERLGNMVHKNIKLEADIVKANEFYEMKIRKLCDANKMWQETCNTLKAKNEKLRGPHWVED
jgi:hypothetical protein